MISKAMYDSTRHQISGDALSAALDSAYRRHPSAWPATVIGISSLDMYSPTFSGDRFVFMSSHGNGNAGFAAISTARMRHGILRHGSAADLEKMAARAAGLVLLSASPIARLVPDARTHPIALGPRADERGVRRLSSSARASTAGDPPHDDGSLSRTYRERTNSVERRGWDLNLLTIWRRAAQRYYALRRTTKGG